MVRNLIAAFYVVKTFYSNICSSSNCFFINLKGDPYIFDRDINASNNIMKLWCLDDQGRPRPKTFTNSNSLIKKAKNKLKKKLSNRMLVKVGSIT